MDPDGRKPVWITDTSLKNTSLIQIVLATASPQDTVTFDSDNLLR